MRKFKYYTYIQVAISIATMSIVVYFNQEIADIVSHNVYINSLILGVFCVSTIFLLVDALCTIRKEYLWRRYGADKRYARSVFGARFESIPTQTGEILEEMAQKWKDSIGWKTTAMEYISGSLIGVGLLGTFIGLMHTMGSVFDVLSSQASGKDLVSGLSVPLSGMATAFSASLMGLSTSLTLGLQSMLLDKSNREFFAAVDDWTISQKEEAEQGGAGDYSNRGAGVKYLSSLARTTADLHEAVQDLLKVNGALMSHSVKSWQEITGEVRELRNSMNEVSKVSSRICELNDVSNQHAEVLNNTMTANTARVERMRVGLDSVMEGSVSRTGELGDHVRQLNENISVLVKQSVADQSALERITEFQRMAHDANFACLQEVVATRTALEAAFNMRTLMQGENNG